MRKGLDITLDGLVVHARRWIQDTWLDANTQAITRINFVLNRLQNKEPIEPIKPIKQYQKYQPIKTNQPSDWAQLIGQANINLALSNQKQLFDKAKSACKQITKNDGLPRPTTLAKAKANRKSID